MQIKSRAKINLFLNVYGKRADGYHLLDSLVMFTEDIYDQIELKQAEQNDFSLNGGEFANLLENSGTNLIERMLEYGKNCYNAKLTKNIPVAAGLGGGSSNAAVTLKALIEQEKLTLKNNEINDICLSVGADVPVCYNQKASYFSGIGEIVEVVNQIPDIWAVLVNPRRELLTKNIFKIGVRTIYNKLTDKPYKFNNFIELIEFIKMQVNGLEEPAIACMPLIKEIINAINVTPNCHLARMSGSGPTCFGLYQTKQDAKNAQTILISKYPEWWIKHSRLA